MDALVSEEEVLLRQAIDGQVDKAVPKTVPDLEDFDDAELWSRLAAGYLLGLGLPEASGGVGSMVDLSIVVASLGAAVAPAPYLGCVVLAGQLLARAGASPAITEEMINGGRRIGVGLDPGMQRLAVLGRDNDIIAFDASGAAAALVLDPSGSLVAIGIGDDLEGLDLTRQFRSCDPHERVVIGDLGRALSDDEVSAWTASALVGLSADLAGNMAGALRLAVEHASTRHQFGVPIGSFQALQHLIADAYVQSDGARGVVQFAAWSIEHAPQRDALRAARTAKAYCSDAAKQVIEAVIQVHGGMGMTWDCPAHLYQRRILTNRVALGDETVHYAHLAMD